MQPHDSRRLEYGKERYHSFRRTIFDNPTQSDCRKAYDKNHKQCSSYNQATWNATGPLISSRQPKTAVASGSAFKTQSLDRIYTSLSPTIESLRFSSFQSKTKRFHTPTPATARVGPGCYDYDPPVKSTRTKLPDSTRLEERSKNWIPVRPDTRDLDDAEEWRSTKAAAKEYSFQKAERRTWIEDAQRSQRTSIKLPSSQMPCFLRGHNPSLVAIQG
uniref:AlNc14C41G3534 protein n=1 Tax=Albugo laibachii Nc14 TaxID=890382 RepID=F0W9T0_9STRA|nr:AlNc14C41G3534 [Albugo laibachii Nc14]|eukprot:CCA17898.1 AlNc14C41G3534 [Albugo laibachii Nc14]